MKGLILKILSGRLEACDFKIAKHSVENGKMIVEATVPGVIFTKFIVHYFSQDGMIISYQLFGLWRYTLHLTFKSKTFSNRNE